MNGSGTLLDEIVEKAGLFVGELVEKKITFFELGRDAGYNAEGRSENIDGGFDELVGGFGEGLSFDVIVTKCVADGLFGVFKIVLSEGVGWLVVGGEFTL